MAASNWDTLALRYLRKPGEKAIVTPCDGSLLAPSGVRVNIYKNWLYVQDEAGWHEHKYCYNRPMVGNVEHGVMRYKDMRVVAVRGPQDGIYVASWYGWEHIEDEPFGLMVGIGCYGYFEEWHVGVEKESAAWLQGWLIQMAASDDIPKIAADMPALSGTYFNQGDAYLSNAFGVDVPTQAPGESGPTMLDEMLEPTLDD